MQDWSRNFSQLLILQLSKLLSANLSDFETGKLAGRRVVPPITAPKRSEFNLRKRTSFRREEQHKGKNKGRERLKPFQY
jgi:hypothetical protein